MWKVKGNPLTLAFNLYLLRDSTDADLGPDFVDASSLTAIVTKRAGKWEMTVVEVIFDSEEKTKISYEDGLKHYVLWDLYLNDKKDKNPKIIFKNPFAAKSICFRSRNSALFGLAIVSRSWQESSICCVFFVR